MVSCARKTYDIGTATVSACDANWDCIVIHSTNRM